MEKNEVGVGLQDELLFWIRWLGERFTEKVTFEQEEGDS
jgi:hypothetical protein